jgi:hypothetical protein
MRQLVELLQLCRPTTDQAAWTNASFGKARTAAGIGNCSRNATNHSTGVDSE